MTVLLISCFLLLLIYAVLLIYYRSAWVSIPVFFPSSVNHQLSARISVIIPARDESENIGQCLQSIFDQSYPENLFEIIVVDDHSTDNTAEIVNGFTGKNIRLISLKDHVAGQLNSYKKKAIEVAVAASTGELIVTTDADCTVHRNWLQHIAELYESKQPAFIAAPVSINCSNSFIEIFQAVDFMTLQGITGASVHKKIHNMCNGANLAYTKRSFIEVNGFSGIDEIASGDDMLLMHKISQKYPGRILFLKSKEAIVQTQPVKTISDFFNQRIRWASKADKYQDKSLFPVLLLVYFFNVMMLILPFAGMLTNFHFLIFNVRFSAFESWLLLLLLKTMIELFFLYPVANFFGKQRLLWLFPLLQPFHIIYTVIAGFLGKFGSYRWKNRTVK